MNLFDVLFAKKLGGGSPFPPVIKRVTGNPIEFSDGADAPLVKCVTAITGSQDLHGYDKPWVGGSGKNKLPNNATSTTVDGVRFDVADDGTITATGTSTGWTGLSIGTCTLEAGTWYMNSHVETDYSKYYLEAVCGGSTYNTLTNPSKQIVLNETTTLTVKLYVPSGQTVNNVVCSPMIHKDGTSATYEPYANICPITAYTEGEIEVRGKNSLPPLNAETITSVGAITKIDGEGRYVFSGATTSGLSITRPLPSSYTIKSGDYLHLCNNQLNSSIDFTLKDTNGNIAHTLLFSVNQRLNLTPYVGRVITSLTVYVASGNNVNDLIIAPMIVPSSSITDFEPYITPTTHTTTYPSAIYRGSEDVVNGEVVTEWGMIASYAGETLPGEWISDRDEYSPGTTPTTGAQVAYALVTPTKSSVTPTNLPIKSLSGYNHIESSTGEMEVDYITDAYQNFVDTTERAIPSTRKGGVKAFDIFKTLDEPKKPEASAEESEPEEKEIEEGAKK